MRAINTKVLNVKPLAEQRFYMKLLSFIRGATYGYILMLIALTIGSSAVAFWVAHHRAPVQNLNNSTNCLPVSEPITINEAKRISYFPSEAFNDDIDMGEVKAKTFPNSLMFMGEPSLLTLPECTNEAYRFLWIRAFKRPIAVRVWQSEGAFYLVAKKLDKEGNLKDVRYRAITESEWATLKSHIEDASFWSLPTVDTDVGNDGDFWILEGAQDGQYHILERWSPKDEKYRAICMYLFNLSGLQAEG